MENNIKDPYLNSVDSSDRSECPSINDLALIIDGRLKGKERDALMAHLDACPACYKQWLEVSAELSEQAGENIENNNKKQIIKNRVTYSGIGLAMAASLALLIFWFPQKSIDNIEWIVKKQYKLVQTYSISKDTTNYTIDSDNIDGKDILKKYGFSNFEKTISPEALSFIHGLETGQILIRTKSQITEDSFKSDYVKDYFYIGLWYGMLSCICGVDQQIPAGFWEMQPTSIEHFKKFLLSHHEDEKEARIILRSFERIQPYFNSKQLKVNRACEMIRTELELLRTGII